MSKAFLATAILTTAVLAAPLQAQRSDEAEIRSVAMRQGDTWSRHDAKAYAALFTENCDVVNVVGWWWKGRAELEQKLTAAFKFVFKDSKLTITDVGAGSSSPISPSRTPVGP